jgi:hypothetical protein
MSPSYAHMHSESPKNNNLFKTLVSPNLRACIFILHFVILKKGKPLIYVRANLWSVS